MSENKNAPTEVGAGLSRLPEDWAKRKKEIFGERQDVSTATKQPSGPCEQHGTFGCAFNECQRKQNNKVLEEVRTKAAPPDIDSELQLATAEALHKSTGAKGKGSSK